MTCELGFVGLGMMGHGIAKNLVGSGFGLTVLGHRNRRPVEDLLARGAREATSARELAAGCEMVFLCVSGTPQVESIVHGEDGLLAGCRPGLILVDCTTSDPTSTRRIAADLRDRGADMADAPVTRAPKDAEAGRLNSLVGASDEIFERILPALRTYSESVVHFGPVGSGHTAKLINNFVTAGYTALIAEGLAVCASAGLDMRKLHEVMSAGAADSGVMRKMVPPLLDGDLTGHQFSLANAHKDVSYFARLIADIGTRSFLVEGVLATYAAALEKGFGERMMASLCEMHERLNDTSIVPRDPREP